MDRKEASPLTVRINLGATICQMIKNFLYPSQPWSACYIMVSSDFTKLKQAARRFYTDMDDTEILRELCRYSAQDCKEMLDTELLLNNKGFTWNNVPRIGHSVANAIA